MLKRALATMAVAAFIGIITSPGLFLDVPGSMDG